MNQNTRFLQNLATQFFENVETEKENFLKSGPFIYSNLRYPTRLYLFIG
jgi:hypothetical protein